MALTNSHQGKPPKRRKSEIQSSEQTCQGDIRSSQQLQQLLRFSQDQARLKKGLITFQTFLDLEPSEPSQPEHAHRLSILGDYLESQKIQDQGRSVRFLQDIMQTWDQAFHADEDSILSIVPTVLASLMRRISGLIQFREYGLQLCRTVLQTDLLKILARGMSSIPTKNYIINPCLRLLTEIATFDGGVFANKIYSNQELSFRSLVRNLGLRAAVESSPSNDVAHVPVRAVASQYFIAVLRFIGPANKTEILRYRSIITAWLKDLRDDAPGLVLKVLDTLKQLVVLDDRLSRRSKCGFFTSWVLGRISTLYGYATRKDVSGEAQLVRTHAHELLLLVCTTPIVGLLSSDVSKSGSGRDLQQPEPRGVFDETDPIDMEGHPFDHNDQIQAPFQSRPIEDFASHLRPHSDELQGELLLVIFKGAPSMVPKYFLKRRTLSFDPKRSLSWIGYCAFLYAVIRLPVGKEARLQSPPPASTAIEHILPQPLTKKVLTRCLNQKSSLVTLLAVRILAAAFWKLQLVLDELARKEADLGDWSWAAADLVNEFCRRCPRLRDVITLLRATPKHQTLQHEAIARLIAMYYTIIPPVALDETFDVTPDLSDIINQVSSEGGRHSQDSAFHLLQLEHHLTIAQCTPNMRWTHKCERAKLSPFTSLVRLYAELSSGELRRKIKTLLRSINREYRILEEGAKMSSLDALLVGFALADESRPALSEYEFLDNAVGRAFRRPIHYEDLLSNLRADKPSGRIGAEGSHVSLLLVSLVEQWPFALRSEAVPASGKVNLARRISRVFEFCSMVGEDSRSLNILCTVLINSSMESVCRGIFKEVPDPATIKRLKWPTDALEPCGNASDVQEGLSARSSHPDKVVAKLNENGDGDLQDDLRLPDPRTLFKAVTKDVQEAVENGDVGQLILCLCSKILSIRMEALSSLFKVVERLNGAEYAERQMVALLLQETLHTAKGIIRLRPFPTYLGAFASQAVLVESNPQHFLYGQVNRFLHKGPIWDLEKVPLVQIIFLNPPEDDGTHLAGVEWLLDIIFRGLQTAQDLDVYRHGGMFERCFSIYSSPHCSRKAQGLILLLALRATKIPGGSDTLSTRLGFLSWIQARLARNDRNYVMLQRLATELQSTCDQNHMTAWYGAETGLV